jgi:hypothetical protein
LLKKNGDFDGICNGISGVQAGFVAQYLELVRKVGVDLRSLLSTVDILVAVFPPAAHREVHFAAATVLKFLLMRDFVVG